MTVLEKITDWLESFPYWETDWQIDALAAIPGSIGLYPQGVQVISRREDVLGNVEVRNRFTLMLYRVSVGEDTAWALALQDWVNGQSAAGLAPQLGDLPEKEQIYAQQGRLTSPAQTGTGRYAVKITAEYVTKIDN